VRGGIASPGAVHGVPVRVGDVRVGVVEDVVADARAERVIGLVVRGQDGRKWFLPWVACTRGAGFVEASSSLVLFPAGQLDYYVRNGVCLRADELDGAAIGAEGRISESELVATVGVLAGVHEGIPRQ
jgi:hypothetical protein